MQMFQIKLLKRHDANAFAEFMRDEYFPAVDRGATRIGKVIGLTLLQGNTTDTTHTFQLLVDGVIGNRMPRVSAAAAKRFDSFEPRVKFVGGVRQVATWRENQ